MLYAHFTTSEGTFTARLFDDEVPNTVANFVGAGGGHEGVDRPPHRQEDERPY